METAAEENPLKHIQKMQQDLASFMAMYDDSESRFKMRREEMDQQVSQCKLEMETRMAHIRAALEEIQEVMSVAGAARWRVAAEKTMKQGEEHLVSIKETCNVFKELAEESVTRLEHVSMATEKRVNSALHHLNQDNSSVVNDFRRLTEETYGELHRSSHDAIQTIRRLMRWLRFDRFFIAIVTAVVVSFLMSAYINAEVPWQSHRDSVQERMIGRTILTIWPSLSKAKQDEINQMLGGKI